MNTADRNQIPETRDFLEALTRISQGKIFSEILNKPGTEMDL